MQTEISVGRIMRAAGVKNYELTAANALRTIASVRRLDFRGVYEGATAVKDGPSAAGFWNGLRVVAARDHRIEDANSFPALMGSLFQNQAPDPVSFLNIDMILVQPENKNVRGQREAVLCRFVGSSKDQTVGLVAGRPDLMAEQSFVIKPTINVPMMTSLKISGNKGYPKLDGLYSLTPTASNAIEVAKDDPMRFRLDVRPHYIPLEGSVSGIPAALSMATDMREMLDGFLNAEHWSSQYLISGTKPYDINPDEEQNFGTVKFILALSNLLRHYI